MITVTVLICAFLAREIPSKKKKKLTRRKFDQEPVRVIKIIINWIRLIRYIKLRRISRVSVRVRVNR